MYVYNTQAVTMREEGREGEREDSLVGGMANVDGRCPRLGPVVGDVGLCISSLGQGERTSPSMAREPASQPREFYREFE